MSLRKRSEQGRKANAAEEAFAILSGLDEELYNVAREYTKSISSRQLMPYLSACGRYIEASKRDGKLLTVEGLLHWLEQFRMRACPYGCRGASVERNKLVYYCNGCGEVVS